MGEALYRKHRSKKLAEIVGQEHITSTLSRALKAGNISHAYLFTGPRGVGKTSIARILAHEVNDLPYEANKTHLDIIEIDAASNRRIDEIRELRDRVHTAPASAKYKVYIIDEVHMLTKEAFNALLKTLEEPPAHVIFILATTEAHKLPETIISRTQRFSFKPIEKSAAIRHLSTIAKSEGIQITPEAIELIAEHGNGSFRDSISMLDQVRGISDSVSVLDVQTLLGIPSSQAIEKIISLINEGNKRLLLEELTQLRERGYLTTQIAKQLAKSIKDKLVENDLLIDNETAGWLLKQLVEVPGSPDPDTLLEIILLTIPGVKPTIQAKKATINQEVKIEPKTSPTQTAPTETQSEKLEPMETNEPQSLDDELWQSALATLKQKHNTLYSLARMATPRFDGSTVTLIFGFAFHQKRLNESANRAVIANILSDLAGKKIRINCELDPNKKPPADVKPVIKKDQPSPIETISNIFGGAEVIE